MQCEYISQCFMDFISKQAVFVFASAGEKAGMFEPIALTKSSSDGPQLGSLS